MSYIREALRPFSCAPSAARRRCALHRGRCVAISRAGAAPASSVCRDGPCAGAAPCTRIRGAGPRHPGEGRIPLRTPKGDALASASVCHPSAGQSRAARVARSRSAAAALLRLRAGGALRTGVGVSRWALRRRCALHPRQGRRPPTPRRGGESPFEPPNVTLPRATRRATPAQANHERPASCAPASTTLRCPGDVLAMPGVSRSSLEQSTNTSGRSVSRRTRERPFGVRRGAAHRRGA